MADRQKLAQLLVIPLLVIFLGLLWTRLQALRGTPQVVTLPAASAPTPPAAPPAEPTVAAPASPTSAAAEAPESPAFAIPPRDPFLPPLTVQQVLRPPPAPIEAPRETPKRPMPTLKVQGVFWGITPPRAIINDQIVTPGDTIQGVRVLSIDRQGIAVEFEGTRTLLTVPAPGSRQNPERGP